MARIESVRLMDDLTGETADETADETIDFALDGVPYVIDLSSEHAQQLREALAGSSQPAGGAAGLPG